MSIGTRGDMKPFFAIGEILKEKGHQVICTFPEQFRSLTAYHRHTYRTRHSFLLLFPYSVYGSLTRYNV